MITERGSATIEFTWLTLILLVPLVYLVIAVFDAQRAAYGVSSASQAAARAFIQSPRPGLAHDRARRAARLALADHDLTDADIQMTCKPACFRPGSTVTVTVATVQRLPLAPDLFGDSVAAIDIDATHTEPFGRYRAALE